MEVNCEPSNLMSPVKIHVRGKGLTSGEKIQIVNVYKTLLNDNPGITVRDIGCKVALSMGVAISTVFKVQSNSYIRCGNRRLSLAASSGLPAASRGVKLPLLADTRSVFQSL